jgi:hypothetical protein
MNKNLDLHEFRTAVEGVEVMAVFDYIPAWETHDHDADLRKVMIAGFDIYELLAEGVKKEICRRFLKSMDEAKEQAKIERMIEARENAA